MTHPGTLVIRLPLTTRPSSAPLGTPTSISSIGASVIAPGTGSPSSPRTVGAMRRLETRPIRVPGRMPRPRATSIAAISGGRGVVAVQPDGVGPLRHDRGAQGRSYDHVPKAHVVHVPRRRRLDARMGREPGPRVRRAPPTRSRPRSAGRDRRSPSRSRRSPGRPAAARLREARARGRPAGPRSPCRGPTRRRASSSRTDRAAPSRGPTARSARPAVRGTRARDPTRGRNRAPRRRPRGTTPSRGEGARPPAHRARRGSDRLSSPRACGTRRASRTKDPAHPSTALRSPPSSRTRRGRRGARRRTRSASASIQVRESLRAKRPRSGSMNALFTSRWTSGRTPVARLT